MSVHERAAAWLARSRSKLAELVTTRHFEQHPELTERYGQQGRARCLEDNAHHLAYLEQAVAAGQHVLFENYVVWARVLLKHLKLPVPDLADNLQILRTIIDERAPDDVAARCLAPLDEILAKYEELPTEVETHLHPSQPYATLAKRYLDLLMRAKRRQASQIIIEAVDDGMSIRDVYRHVFQPVQYEIGRLWQLNQVSVAQEHFCTAATQMIMSQLYPRLFTADFNGYRLVTACAYGDLHEIGARFLTDFFEMAGWDTYYIGANTPMRSLVQTLHEQDVHLVALSATLVTHVPVIAATVETIRAEFPDLPIMVGGFPFLQAPELARNIGVDATAPDAESAVRVGLELVQRAAK